MAEVMLKPISATVNDPLDLLFGEHGKPIETSLLVQAKIPLRQQTITEKDIAWLWIVMTKAYGYKFITNFGEKDNGVWFDALCDLTRDDLNYGFDKLMHDVSENEMAVHEVWPPNVKEFRTYCIRQYADYGLLSPSAAFKELENNRYSARAIWSHPLVCLAAEKINALNCIERRDRLYANFAEYYKDLCARYIRGERIAVTHTVLSGYYYRQIHCLEFSADQKMLYCLQGANE